MRVRFVFRGTAGLGAAPVRAALALGGMGAGTIVVNAAIHLRNLTVSYRRHPALHHIDGVFEEGSLTAIIGANGAGKSTLLKSIQGLVPFDSGQIMTTMPRKRIAYLPQQSEVDRSFPITVMDCVLMGDWGHSGAFRRIKADALQRVQRAIATVGLQGFEGRPLSTLSAGQFQRVLFARAMVQDAALILLDEPFNAIDERTVAELMAIVQQWHREGRTVLAVVHDKELVWRHFPQTLLLARRVIAWGPTSEVLRPELLQRARLMHEAWDDTAQVCDVTESA